MSARSATTPPGRPPRRTAHDPGLRHGVANLEAEGAQPLRDQTTGALLAVAQLGVRMEVTADGHQGGRDTLGRGADLGVGNGGRGSEESESQQHRGL